MLADVMASVAAKLAEQGVTASLVDGRENLSRDVGASRFVWFDSADEYEPRRASGNPPSFMTRNAGCEVHVHGVVASSTATLKEHRAVMNALVHQFLFALHRVAEGSYRIRGGSMEDDGELVYGAVYVLQFSVAIPVVGETWASVKLDAGDVVSTGSVIVGGTPTVACECGG